MPRLYSKADSQATRRRHSASAPTTVRQRQGFVTRAIALLLCAAGMPAVPLAASGDEVAHITRPLPPEYHINRDGSVTLRVCFNWSCSTRSTVTFSRTEMTSVAGFVGQCSNTTLYDRAQRLRIAVWQMELLAQKHIPVLANDRGINDKDGHLEGRTDCVDNASNTTNFLHILRDLSKLPGWTIDAPEVRHPLNLRLVHWTAVAVDEKSGSKWSVDSWFRPNGHLPYVMPLAEWVADKQGWVAPFDALNPFPAYVGELCEKPGESASRSSAPASPSTTRDIRG